MFSVFTYLYSHHHHLIQSTPVTPESALIPTSSLSSLSLPSIPGVSRLLVSLGHTGRRVVLGHTLNTQIVKKKKTPHNVLSKFTILCWAPFISHPWIPAARGVQVGHPCQPLATSNLLSVSMDLLILDISYQ